MNTGAFLMNGFDQEIAGVNSVTGTNASSFLDNVVSSSGAATLTISGSGSYSFGDGTNQNSGVLDGALSLVKAGTGTQTLGDTNTYTGTTTITGGTLALGANGSIETSPTILLSSGSAVFDVSGVSGFTVVSGQTLGGVGTVVGDVTLGFEGVLAPGLSPGTLTFGGNLDISAADSGTLVFELGSTSDLIDLSSGVLEIGPEIIGFSNFNFTAIAGFGPGVYTLFQSTQAISGDLNMADLEGTVGAFDATLGLANSGNNIVLTVVVPEPSTVALAAAGAIGLLAAAKRRVVRLRRLGHVVHKN